MRAYAREFDRVLSRVVRGQLLVATILSAQCTDERVNKVTPALFKKYPNARAFAEADRAERELAVRPTGFFRNKTKSVLGMAQALVEGHGGKVPDTMEALTALPGSPFALLPAYLLNALLLFREFTQNTRFDFL